MAWARHEGGGDICQHIYRNTDLVSEVGREGLAAGRSSSAQALQDEHSDRRVLYPYGGSSPALQNIADLFGLFDCQATEQENEDPPPLLYSAGARCLRPATYAT